MTYDTNAEKLILLAERLGVISEESNVDVPTSGKLALIADKLGVRDKENDEGFLRKITRLLLNILRDIFGRWDEIYLSDVLKMNPKQLMILGDLQSKWIYTLPEFLGVLGALRGLPEPPPDLMLIEAVYEDLQKNIESFYTRKNAKWDKYASFWLSLEDQPVLQPIKKSYSFEASREYDLSKISFVFEDGEMLPISAFIEHPFPIREQCEGSCVAQSLGTMIEFLQGKDFDQNRTKELYDKIRTLDGSNAPEGGTWLKTAISFAQDGAYGGRLWDSGMLVLNQGDIFALKRTLAGSRSRKPSPIIAAFKTYASSTDSLASLLSGKWTLPVTGETPNGGHAITIFGYRDDPSAAPVGGGYFIARNSWSDWYALDSPIGKPGYTLIPYAYAMQYCLEMYAADLPVETRAPEFHDDFEQRYTWTLKSDATECFEDDEGNERWVQTLKRGERVVGLRDDPEHIMRYTRENREKFIDNNYSWTRKDRLRRHFPPLAAQTVSESTPESSTKELGAARTDFMNGVATNLRKLSRSESTLSHSLFSVRFFDIEDVSTDISSEVRLALARANGLPNRLFDIPREYSAAFETSATVRFWRVDGGKGAVVAAFIAPLAFKPDESPVFIEPTQKDANVVVKTIKDIILRQKRAPKVICGAFGTANGVPETFVNAANAEGFALTTGAVLREDLTLFGRCWQRAFASATDERAAPFFKALQPTTLEDVGRAVLAVVDSGYLGDATIDYLLKKLDFTFLEAEVREAIDELVRSGKLTWYKTARGEDAVRR